MAGENPAIMIAVLTKLLVKYDPMRRRFRITALAGQFAMKLRCSISLAALPVLAALTMVGSLCGPAKAQPDVDTYIAQGREALKARKPDDALAAFDSAIALDAANSRAFASRASARMQKQDRDGALADVEQAISIDPLYALAYRIRAVIWSIKKDRVRAIEDFNRAIELDPDDAMAYFARGMFLASTDRNYAAAIQDFGRTISANPRYVEAYLQRGQLYQHDKKFDLALADYDAAIKVDPNNTRAYTKRGEIQLQTEPAGENFDRAIVEFEQAVRTSPDDPLLKRQLEGIKGLKELYRVTIEKTQ